MQSFFQIVHVEEGHAVAVRCSICSLYLWRGWATQEAFVEELREHQEMHDRASEA